MVCSLIRRSRLGSSATPRPPASTLASDQRLSATGRSSLARARSMARVIPMGRTANNSRALRFCTTLGCRTLSMRERPMDA